MTTTIRGVALIVGAFVFCPCHLPLTLFALTALLSGTGLAWLPVTHPYALGGVLTVVWGVGTWHGMRLLRRSDCEGGACGPAAKRDCG